MSVETGEEQRFTESFAASGFDFKDTTITLHRPRLSIPDRRCLGLAPFPQVCLRPRASTHLPPLLDRPSPSLLAVASASRFVNPAAPEQDDETATATEASYSGVRRLFQKIRWCAKLLWLSRSYFSCTTRTPEAVAMLGSTKSILSKNFTMAHMQQLSRLLLLEICVIYAKRRCIPPFFCVVNMSSAKTVSLNGSLSNIYCWHVREGADVPVVQGIGETSRPSAIR